MDPKVSKKLRPESSIGSLAVPNTQHAELLNKVDKLIVEKKFSDVIELLEQAPAGVPSVIAKKLVAASQHYIDEPDIAHLPQNNIHPTVDFLNKNDPVWVVCNNLDKLGHRAQLEICKEVFNLTEQAIQASALPANLDKLNPRIKSFVLNKFFKEGRAHTVIRTLELMQPADQLQIATRAITEKTQAAEIIAYSIRELDPSVIEPITNLLLAAGEEKTLAGVITDLPKQQQLSVVQALIESHKKDSTNTGLHPIYNIKHQIKNLAPNARKAFIRYTLEGPKFELQEIKDFPRAFRRVVVHKNIETCIKIRSPFNNAIDVIQLVDSKDLAGVLKRYYSLYPTQNFDRWVDELPESERESYLRNIAKASGGYGRGLEIPNIAKAIKSIPPERRKTIALMLLCRVNKPVRLEGVVIRTNFQESQLAECPILIQSLPLKDRTSVAKILIRRKLPTVKNDWFNPNDYPESERKELVRELIKKSNFYLIENNIHGYLTDLPVNDRKDVVIDFFKKGSKDDTQLLELFNQSIKLLDSKDLKEVFEGIIEHYEKINSSRMPRKFNSSLDTIILENIEKISSEDLKEIYRKLSPTYRKTGESPNQNLLERVLKSCTNTEISDFLIELCDFPEHINTYILNNKPKDLEYSDLLAQSLVVNFQKNYSIQNPNQILDSFRFSEERAKAKEVGLKLEDYIFVTDTFRGREFTNRTYIIAHTKLENDSPYWKRKNLNTPFSSFENAAKIHGYEFVFRYFSGTNPELHTTENAEKLMFTEDIDHAWVRNVLERTPEDSRKAIAIYAAEGEQGNLIAQNKFLFSESDWIEISDKLVEHGYNLTTDSIRSILEGRSSGDQKEIVYCLMALEEKVYDRTENCRVIKPNEFAFILEFFKESESDLKEIALALVNYQIDNMANFSHNYVPEIFKLLNKNTQEAVVNRLLSANQSDKLKDSLKIIKTLNLGKRYAKELSNNYSFSDDEIEKIFQLKEERIRANALGINLQDYIFVTDLLTDKKPTEDKFKAAYERLKSTRKCWANRENILDPFEKAAERLGYRFMLSYVGSDRGNLHDACFALDEIFLMPARLGIEDPDFHDALLKKLMFEVRKDRSINDLTNSYQRLNEIANSDLIDPTELLAKVESDPDMKEVPDFINAVRRFADNKSELCSTWDQLVRYSNLANFYIKNKSVALELAKLRQTSKHKAADYFERIAFDQGSNVNLNALVQFMVNPGAFLNRNDAHAIKTRHEHKKPINYTRIPHLGLSAEDLRDALINGILDQIQVIPPITIEYQFARTGMIANADLDNLPIKDLIKKALGSRRNNTPALLSDEQLKVCFQRLQAQVNDSVGQKTNFANEFLNGDLELDPNEESKLRSIVRKFVEADHKLDLEPKRFLVKIHPKSSPDAAIAGDQTKCCMTLDSGKNIVYTFNLNCVQFTIQTVNSEGKPEKSVAQSVVTVNLDIKKDVPEVIDSISSGIPYHYIVPEDSLPDLKRYLVCDSIERNSNFCSVEGNVTLIKLMYEDAFKVILDHMPEHYAVGHTMDKSKVLIPNGNFQGPFAEVYPAETNQYIPLCPMSYSDNSGLLVRVMTPQEHGLARVIHEANKTNENPFQLGVCSPLTYMDTLHITYLESKVYEGTTLSEALHNIQNGIMAKDIANPIRKNENLSIKYLSSSGMLEGYLIAYEGIHDQTKEPCIYVGDFAAKNKNSLEAGKILLSFMDKYKQFYLDRNNPLPIYMEARSETSYKLLRKQLRRMGQKLGCEFRIDERGKYFSGSNTMHSLKITCHRENMVAA